MLETHFRVGSFLSYTRAQRMSLPELNTEAQGLAPPI